MASPPITPERSRQLVHRRRFRWRWAIIAVAFCLWMGYHQLRRYVQTPQAVLVLGGALEREYFAANFALQHPDLPIWVSSGSNREYSEWVFAQAGVDLQRIHLDYGAVDTVTNFTTLVDTLQSQGITSIYLITSDDHMRRAQTIAEIVLGSRGIDFKPVAVPTGRSPEPLEKTLRDGVRAFIWVTTGYTGADLNQRLKSSR